MLVWFLDIQLDEYEYALNVDMLGCDFSEEIVLDGDSDENVLLI